MMKTNTFSSSGTQTKSEPKLRAFGGSNGGNAEMNRRKEEVAKRKSIIFYTNWLEMIMNLPHDKIGDLLELCYRYTQTGDIPEDLKTNDLAVKMCFDNFRVAEDANWKEWQQSCRQRRINRNVGMIKKLRSEGLTDTDILSIHPEYYDILQDIK